jgi:hypothetical protein
LPKGCPDGPVLWNEDISGCKTHVPRGGKIE